MSLAPIFPAFPGETPVLSPAVVETVNKVTTWNALKGKPYIIVSAKGISNGQSTIPNDGADFGPDTMFGATSKDQYGPPYTQTAGIQEAWNYAFSTAISFFALMSGDYWMQPIHLLEGVYEINQKIIISPSIHVLNPKMTGSGSMSTYIYWNFNDNCIEIDHTNPNISGSNIEIGYMQPIPGSNVGAGTAFFAANYVSTDPSYMANIFQSYDLDFSNTFPGLAMLSLSGVEDIILYNCQAYSGGVYGILYAENVNTVQIFGDAGGGNYVAYLSNVNFVAIYGLFYGGIVLNNISYLYMSKLETFGPQSNIQLTGITHFLHIDFVNVDRTATLLSTTSSASIFGLKLDYIWVNANSTLTLLGSNININNIFMPDIEIDGGSSVNLPTMSTSNGSTAGTVEMNAIEYTTVYKKYIITFSGYKNDTTTNQIINFPLAFSTSAVISANNTGLTISATTSGITITAPDSTTTYNGIVIIEGY